MLRWPGDFSLPRFRAKLANKYLLHPDVEPGYEEVYRPELGESIIVRKDYGRAAALRRGDVLDVAKQDWQSKQGARGSLDLSSGGLSAVAADTAQEGPKRNLRALRQEVEKLEERLDDPSQYKAPLKPGTHLGSSLRAPTPGGRQSASDGAFGGGGGTMRSSWNSSSRSLPSLGRTMSVPSLGVRRQEVPPASLHPSPVGPALIPRKSASGASLMIPASPTSPMAGGEDKMNEKEKAIEAASKRLWQASIGSEVYFQWQLLLPDQTNPPSLKNMETPVGIKKAMDKGAKLDWRNEEWDGATLLIQAVRRGKYALAMWLLDHGADALVVDNSGRGALHWAAMEGHSNLLEFLLGRMPEGQVPLNQGDMGGDAPLHLAAYNGHLPAIRLLVRAQADPHAANSLGYTPAELADVRRMWHVSRYLREYRQQEEDRSAEEMELRDFVRPCDLVFANVLRAEAADKPKPKGKK